MSKHNDGGPDDTLISALRGLVASWRDVRMAYETDDERAASSAYENCADDLSALLAARGENDGR